LATFAVAVVTGLVVSTLPASAATTLGVDVSHFQGSINWTTVHNAGIQFAYIKATEGTSFRDSAFGANYVGAFNAGVVRGAYHFALPDRSSGAVQADFFASNGGGWSRDNRTLPGTLDIEYNPYGATCYGLSQGAMVNWVHDFANRYHARTSRWPVIYTTTNWWTQCTGNNSGFAANSPLYLARYASSPGALPAGWSFYTFWQYTSSGSVSGIPGAVDRDYFNGTQARLVALANDTP
jgi:GH25 family lysozyme M1 (1,4-beta-N-acetylmuramidase)